MAHNLETRNGITSFASTRNAWHGLGTIVEKAMTSEEAIKLANLNYEVEKVQVFTNVKEQFLPVPDKFATMRKDTNDVLGIVGKGYTVLQNVEAFNFFDSIVEKGMAIFETAGVLGKGERIFVSAKLPKNIRIAGTDDLTEMYVLLTSAHDGSGAIQACTTGVRTVCQNTLNSALKGATNKVSIRHTNNVRANLEQAHKFLHFTNLYLNEMNSIYNSLALKALSDAQMKSLINELFTSEKDDSTRIKNIRERVLECYFTGVGQQNIIGTCWGAYNAITYYTSHKDYKDSTSKFDAIINGSGQKIGEKALNLLVSF